MIDFASGRLRAALLLTAIASAGCSDDDNGDDGENNEFPVISIGALVDRSGTSASTSYDNALKLAESHVNEALSDANIPIRFRVLAENSESREATAIDATTKLVNTDGVVGMVADVSANTVAVNKLNYDTLSPLQSKVPITCYACSSAFVNNAASMQPTDPVREAAERDEENWLYRVFFNGKYEAAVSVRIMLRKGENGDINGDGLFKVGVYAQPDNFGQSSTESLQAAVNEQLEGSDLTPIVEVIKAEAGLDPATYDFAKDLNELVDNQTDGVVDGEPDAIFLALLPQLAAGAVNARYDLGLTVPMQSVTAFRRNYILNAIGEKAVGLEGDSPRVQAKDESGDAFYDSYVDKYQDVPEMLSTHVYDCAVTLMLGALKAAKDLDDPSTVEASQVRAEMLSVTDTSGEAVHTTTDGLRQAVTLIRDDQAINYRGASGVFPWDPVGDTFPEMVHWTVVNQPTLRFDEVGAYECSPDKPTCEYIPEE
jgi:ABC-type branched-subunit amino acid transport system substrate-binding protein